MDDQTQKLTNEHRKPVPKYFAEHPEILLMYPHLTNSSANYTVDDLDAMRMAYPGRVMSQDEWKRFRPVTAQEAYEQSDTKTNV